MTVIVTQNRISAVGRDLPAPSGALVVDGSGKFLIPGLWDTHVHLRGDAQMPRFTTYGEPLLLAYGVTGVRIMAGHPMFHRIRREIAAGGADGPRLEISSRNMDGLIPARPLPPKAGDSAAEAEEWRSIATGEIPRAYQITNAAQAKAAVAEARNSGVQFLKIHSELTPEAYFALASEAKANGLYVAGHVPTGVSVAALSDSGMRSVEHFGGMLEGCSSREDELLKASLAALALPAPQRAQRNNEIRRMAVDSFSAERCAALAARLVKNETWLSPTFMPEGGIREQAKRYADVAKYVFPPLRARWEQQTAAATAPAPLSPAAQELAKLVEAREHEIVRIMKRGGVQFVIGSDAGPGWKAPGPTLHDGMAETVKAGLTPMEVLVAATSSSARLLRRDKDLGTVQAGKLADLVLLNANPLQDIANARMVDAVVVDGRLLDRKRLDQMLAQLAAANAR
jgi:imidazolonepropionase-like amidohydrolase